MPSPTITVYRLLVHFSPKLDEFFKLLIWIHQVKGSCCEAIKFRSDGSQADYSLSALLFPAMTGNKRKLSSTQRELAWQAPERIIFFFSRKKRVLKHQCSVCTVFILLILTLKTENQLPYNQSIIAWESPSLKLEHWNQFWAEIHIVISLSPWKGSTQQIHVPESIWNEYIVHYQGIWCIQAKEVFHWRETKMSIGGIYHVQYFLTSLRLLK